MTEEVKKMIDLLERAIKVFGEQHQKNKCIEECSELIDALIKEMDGRESDVITEIADVCIMARQMTLIYGVENVQAEITRKLGRLENMVSAKEKLIMN